MAFGKPCQIDSRIKLKSITIVSLNNTIYQALYQNEMNILKP